MTYVLGIDLGTTFTAAAVCRRDGNAWGQAEVVTLGSRTAAVSSVLFVDGAGGILVGEAAERRALTDPTRIVREVKRRIGDEVPVLIDGVPWSAQDLLARLARWVVDTVTAREGGAAELVAITHPAGWGTYRKGLLAQALRSVGIADAVLTSEPHAAAISYVGEERVAEGSTIAVYDLGGGTFDATVLRKTGPESFAQLSDPVGHDRLGGMDFDALIFDRVRDEWAAEFARLSMDDPGHLRTLSRLRRECAEAKEALSEDTDVVIPVLLPELQTQFRLTRAEFEAMISPSIHETAELLASAVQESGIDDDALTAVLLVGGSARIPYITEVLSTTLGRPVVVDVDPKAAVARGAALALLSMMEPTSVALPVAGVGTASAAPVAPPISPDTDRRIGRDEPRTRRPKVRAFAIAGGLAVAAVLVTGLTALPDQLMATKSPAPAAAAGTADSSAVGGTNHSGSGGGGGGRQRRTGPTRTSGQQPQQDHVAAAVTASSKPGPRAPGSSAAATQAPATTAKATGTTQVTTQAPPPPPTTQAAPPTTTVQTTAAPTTTGHA